MKKYILLTTLLFISCLNSTKITKDLVLLESNNIILPEQCEIVYNGTDSTLVTNFFHNKYKLIVYSDSAVCSSCSIGKMYLWDSFVEYAKLYDGKLKYYFIFNPKKENLQNFKKSILESFFEYPILIDKNGDFERLNSHLPKNKALHTFLLDENNKVILVGNPLHNKEVEKLFYKKTQELLTN